MSTLLTCDPLKRSLKFGVYQEARGVIDTYLAGPQFLSASWQRDTLAGAFTGVTETLFECPFENVKVAMYSEHKSFLCLPYTYKNDDHPR